VDLIVRPKISNYLVRFDLKGFVYKSRNLKINAFIELTSNVSIRFGGKENRENTHTSKGILIVIIDQNFFLKILK